MNELKRLVESSAILLIDAYGVLMTHSGVIEHAREFIEYLGELESVERLKRSAGAEQAAGAARSNEFRKYYVLTNDASRSPEKSSERFIQRGIPIDSEHIITSGMTLRSFFEERKLAGARAIVLGTEDSGNYLKEAGGVLVEPADDAEFDMLVVCDEMGFPFLETADRVLTSLFRNIDRRGPKSVLLVLANPDLIYPGNDDRYGFTAGSVALLFENALKLHYPGEHALEFVTLGKPSRPIYEEAFRRTGTMNMLMLGDQILTDIKGARDFGIRSALMTTGLTRKADIPKYESLYGLKPDYVLDSLSLE
jgi:ribonucleotide monophosphatase NagD (HAD superfamily)